MPTGSVHQSEGDSTDSVSQSASSDRKTCRKRHHSSSSQYPAAAATDTHDSQLPTGEFEKNSAQGDFDDDSDVEVLFQGPSLTTRQRISATTDDNNSNSNTPQPQYLQLLQAQEIASSKSVTWKDNQGSKANVLAETINVSTQRMLVADENCTNGVVCLDDDDDEEEEEETLLTALGNDKETEADSALSYTPLTSAYLQNLAEICWTCMEDQRWRIRATNERLFQWERGDDLSAVIAFSRRFILPTEEDYTIECSCLLCRDDKPMSMENRVKTPARTRHEVLQEEEDDRCLLLYSRLFYRKGPWFRLDDLYKRYYVARNRAANNANGIDERVIQAHLDAFESLLIDLDRLRKKGFIRGFKSEEECGKTIDTVLLTNVERGKVLFQLAAGNKNARLSSCPPGDLIWKQMKSQRPLFPVAANVLYLPVQRHVTKIVLESLARTMLQISHPNHMPSVREISTMQQRIKNMEPLKTGKEVIQLVAGFCLRAEPHRTLARCARLFLCASHGPGNMRGDGSNGWRSLQLVADTSPIAGIQLPGIHLQHFSNFPGLQARFGLSSFPFRKSFIYKPRNDESRSPSLQVFSTRHAFQAFECCIELRANVDFAIELDNALKWNQKRATSSEPKHAAQDHRAIDFLSVTTQQGRGRIVRKLLEPSILLDRLLGDIEADVETYGGAFESDCQKILFSVAVVACHVLCLRNKTINHEELDRMKKTPWLRHLWWDGNLSYILWDTVPFLEKQNHLLSVLALETLLFGRQSSVAPVTLVPAMTVNKPMELASCLLSRRTRGKACSRLMVDYRHLLKKEKASVRDDKKKYIELHDQQTESVRNFFHQTISLAIVSATIPFSSIREVARPLKQPLEDILRHYPLMEASELGLRLKSMFTTAAEPCVDKYSEWSPTIDTALANALIRDENASGSRCAYIGFEDRGGNASPSLNVEELAMEYYYSGRLPEHDERGGWRGFHDEGSNVHALFRILCAAPVLGMDWGCGRSTILSRESIFLTPYQHAPFDLFVGHAGTDNTWPSFFRTRHAAIDSLLTKLQTLDDQQLSDLVYEAVSARLTFMLDNRLSDPTSASDVLRLRTLSAIAVGLGGKLLASIFRCLCFDYRHFRGGMPDLLLLRATRSMKDGIDETLDLGEWIGELFLRENEEKSQSFQVAMMASDEEFLGCSMGDSGNVKSSSSRNRSGTRSPENKSKMLSADLLPPRLQLVYNDEPVNVEAMFVEVKSANDRLDPRQQDWLNILDLNGNARVCKFELKKTKTQKIE
jgi:hypothetical protein